MTVYKLSSFVFRTVTYLIVMWGLVYFAALFSAAYPPSNLLMKHNCYMCLINWFLPPMPSTIPSNQSQVPWEKTIMLYSVVYSIVSKRQKRRTSSGVRVNCYCAGHTKLWWPFMAASADSIRKGDIKHGLILVTRTLCPPFPPDPTHA